MKYKIIYSDCPWKSNTQFGRDKKKGNKQHYPLMGLEEIKNLPVNEIADDDCILFLWIVNNQLFDAKEVIESWGFSFATVGFTWVKTTSTGKDHFGVGMWSRNNPEICLIATKGKPKRKSASVRELQKHPIREHSRKPDEIRDEIVKLCGDLPRIELFAISEYEGWTCIGNEIDGKDIRESLKEVIEK